MIEDRGAYRPGGDIARGNGSAIPRPGARVLVADDSPVNRALVKKLLERDGFVVDVAVNGREAVEKALCGRFDLVLMDCDMPEMDGFAATEAIRRAEVERGSVRLPIVALTASVLEETRQRCLAVGMDAFAAKPIGAGDLSSLVSKYARRNGSGDLMSGRRERP